jgi:two-component system, OmpR family, response regulator
MRALLVEDDLDIAHDVEVALRQAGFVVDQSRNGEDAWFKGSTESYQVIVLDVGLPKLDGISVLRNWRREDIKTPVIILTARSNWTERVDGIEAGADDYLGKPFQMEELIARVKALVRRSSGIANPILSLGTLRLDTRTNIASIRGAKVDLGPMELRLLMHLMLNAGAIVSQNTLIEALYGFGGAPNSNAIEALVRRLRKKIGDNTIMTHRGFGYGINIEQQ